MEVAIHGWKELGAAMRCSPRTAQRLHAKCPVPRVINGKPVLFWTEFEGWLDSLNDGR
jgi:hypothetical protein